MKQARSDLFWVWMALFFFVLATIDFVYACDLASSQPKLALLMAIYAVMLDVLGVVSLDKQLGKFRKDRGGVQMSRASAVIAAIKSKFKKASCKHLSTRKNLIKINEYVNKADKDDIVKIIVSQSFCKDCGTNLGGAAEVSMGLLEIPDTGEVYQVRGGV